MFAWEILKGEDNGCTLHEQNMEAIRQAPINKALAERWAAREELEAASPERLKVEPIVIDVLPIEQGEG